jgi:RNA polymerase sigma-70 factor (ECF subfamily)
MTGSAVSTAPQVSDAEAIARARSGDHEGFRILVDRYQGRAFRLARRVLRDEETARDAVQEALLKAYASLDRFEGRSSFYTWLYRLVMNQCLDLKRRDRSNRQVDWDDGDPVEAAGALQPPPEVAGVRFAPAAEVMRKELRELVSEAIEQLPGDARQTLLMREVDGLSYAEIAKAQGIPKGTVMSRLHYARRRVRELLIEAGVERPGGPDGTAEEGEGS